MVLNIAFLIKHPLFLLLKECIGIDLVFDPAKLATQFPFETLEDSVHEVTD